MRARSGVRSPIVDDVGAYVERLKLAGPCLSLIARVFHLLRRCATDISLSLASAGRSMPLFVKNRPKFNEPFFTNGDT